MDSEEEDLSSTIQDADEYDASAIKKAGLQTDSSSEQTVTFREREVRKRIKEIECDELEEENGSGACHSEMASQLPDEAKSEATTR